jgi:hypothetical protein
VDSIIENKLKHHHQQQHSQQIQEIDEPIESITKQISSENTDHKAYTSTSLNQSSILSVSSPILQPLTLTENKPLSTIVFSLTDAALLTNLESDQPLKEKLKLEPIIAQIASVKCEAISNADNSIEQNLNKNSKAKNRLKKSPNQQIRSPAAIKTKPVSVSQQKPKKTIRKQLNLKQNYSNIIIVFYTRNY